MLFFDTAFELFHELFFPPGSYLFDPATDRLVQLFPESFWVETTIGVGVVIVVLSAGLAWWGGRRAASIEASAAPGTRRPDRIGGDSMNDQGVAIGAAVRDRDPGLARMGR